MWISGSLPYTGLQAAQGKLAHDMCSRPWSPPDRSDLWLTLPAHVTLTHWKNNTMLAQLEKLRNTAMKEKLTALQPLPGLVLGWHPLFFSKSGFLQCRFITLYPTHSAHGVNTSYPAHGAHGVSTLHPAHGTHGVSILYPAHSAHGVSILYPAHGAHRVSTYASCSHSKCQGLWLYGSLVSYSQPVAREHLQVTGNYVSMVGPLHRNIAPAESLMVILGESGSLRR